MRDRVRIGIIGAGWWAANTHVPALRATGDVDIVAACRRSPDRLQEFADKIGVPETYLDHEEMLDKAKLDAVLVSSPHSYHYEHVKAALNRGIPVLTDKPMSIRSEQAIELCDLADAKGVKLAVVFGGAYDSAHRYIGRELQNGRIGALADANCTYYANPDMLGFYGNAEFQENPDEFPILPTQFRADPILGGGGYLQDVGNHALSSLIIGTGLRVSHVSAMMDQTPVDLRTRLSLRFTNGAIGSVTVIGNVRPPVTGYWGAGHFTFVGDLGAFWRDMGGGPLRYQRWPGEAETIPESELPTPTNPDENFIRALQGEAQLIAPGRLAAECVRVIEAAYRSAETGVMMAVG